jgi:O-antigen/teichoic acid export membrane protein
MVSSVAIAVKNRWTAFGLERIGLALAGGDRPRAEFLTSAWWSFAAAVVARGSNVVALMICAHALTQVRFGELAIIQSTAAMFGPLAGLGLGMTTTKYLAEFRQKDPARAGKILGLSLVTATLAGLLMSFALIALAPLLAAKSLGAPQLASGLAGTAGLLFFGVLEAVLTGALTGLEAFSRVAALSLWNGLLSLPLTAFLVYRYGITGAIAAMTVSVALMCLLDVIVLVGECRRLGFRPSLSGCLSERHILLAFSLPSYLSGIIMAPIGWVANAMLVRQQGGYSQMALFTAADRWRFFLIFVPLAVSRIAVPQFARYRAEGDHHGYRKAFRLNLGLGMLMTAAPALLCATLAAPLMAIYGRAFRDGALILAILALSAVPTVLNTQLGAVLLSANRAWRRTGVDLLLAGLFLGLASWAVPRWGAAGLASAFALAYTVASIVLLFFVRKIHATA